MTPRVYVVDDDSLVTASLGTVLRLETEWDVSTSNSATDALAEMEHAPPDVVLSDLKMPHLDGIGFLKQVRRRFPDAVLILLTGYADKESAIQAINEVGLWQYVEKPWDTDELLIKVRQGLERRDLIANLSSTNQELARRVAELETAREQLLRSERLAAVGRVMSGLAHEIGNQLGLLGYAELILQKTTDPDVSEYARMILQGQQRLTTMIGEIKDFTRGTDGQYRREPGDVAAVVEEALAILRFDREVQGHKLVPQVLGRPLARFNRGKLIQVVLNLTRNAAQASPPGGEVRVVVEADQGEAPSAIIRIIDQGQGMSPEAMARLGEPFYTTRDGGSGLGLGISRRIVEEHEGTMRIRSELGRGTEVEVRLPAVVVARAAAGSEEAAAETTEAARHGLSSSHHGSAGAGA